MYFPVRHGHLSTGNPYYQLMDNSLVNGTYIFAPVASSPVINIIIAIDADGTLAQQDIVTNSLMFTHTNNNNMLTPISGLVPAPDNFQLYTYTYPPLQLRNNGTYTIHSGMDLYHNRVYISDFVLLIL